MAQVLKIGQENVSRIDKRSDLLISTLRGFVEAMGGRLSLVAEFPDRSPVRLRTLADVGEEDAAGRRKDERGRVAAL